MKLAHRTKKKIEKGTQGAISILLCLVLCPFLTISLMLVEASRYQQAIETLNEVNNSATLSTLANMDSYVQERFGFFATSQEEDVSSVYQRYLASNWGVLGAGATLNTASVNFDSSLSLASKEVLKQQILEFSELTVATEVVVEGLDLEQLIETLESLGDLDAISKSFEAVSATADVATAASDLVKNVNDTLAALTTYSQKYTAYYEAHAAFLAAAMDLQTTIDTEMKADSNLSYPADITPTPTPPTSGPTPVPEPPKTSVYDNGNVKAKMTVLEEKRAAYATACGELATNIGEIKDKLDSIVTNLNDLQEKIDKLKELAAGDSSSSTSNVSAATADSSEIYQMILDEIQSALVDFTSDTAIDGLEQDADDLNAMKLALTNFDAKTIRHDTTEADIENLFALIDIAVPDIDLLNQALSNADTTLGGGDSGQSIITIIENMVNSISGLFELDVFYDATLDSYIKTEYMNSLNTATGSDKSSAQLVLESIKTMMDAAETFTDALSSWDFFKALKAIATVCKAVVTFFEAIIAWFQGLIDRLTELVTGGLDGFYESMLVCGYCAYDFPSRTDNKEDDGGSALTGYKYDDIAKADSSSSAGIAGDLNALVDLLKNMNSESSEDITFCGAELEYILIGTQSEIINQASSFVYVYLMRMLFNILPIAFNAQVAEMAASATVGAPVVYILEFILEPLCDTIILVNGGEAFLWKNFVYCTPAGAIKLVEDLIDVTPLGDELKDALKKLGSPDADGPDPGASIGDFIKDGLFRLDYKDHMMFLLMFTCPEGNGVLPRVQHLVQMESESFYIKEAASYTFDLKKTYAFVNFSVDATLNPMFSVEKMSDIGYPYKQSIFRGY